MATGEGVICRVYSRVDMSQNMQMIRSTSVVPWNQSRELQDAIIVAHLDAAKGGVVDVGCIRNVSVILGDNASINTLLLITGVR